MMCIQPKILNDTNNLTNQRRRHRTFQMTAATFLFATIFVQPCMFNHECLLVYAALTNSPTSSSNNHSNSRHNDELVRNSFFPPSAASGPIEDASCNVEQLEQANDSQLHVILQELMTTAFFRSFAVDLNHHCPLSGWSKKKYDKNDPLLKTPTSSSGKIGEAIEGESSHQECTGVLPDLDPHAEPACSVDLSAGKTSTAASAPFALSTMTTPDSFITEESKRSGLKENESEVEEDFECNGGADELDDDAEPLCSLANDPSSNTNPFSENQPFFSSIESAALHSISKQLQDKRIWQSESQKKTFDWARPSDPVIENYDEPCDDEAGNLPKTFWLDMCSQIKMGEGMSIVNLQLNPERNTGYNGTHIWNAIYQENCLAVDGSNSAPMCYEERVLYRLLSGLHTSTTLSIAKNYYPPSKRKGRINWEPNPQYFIDKFADHPDHLRNLHFSYVVLLRALKKASPFLYNYDIMTGDILDDEMATILLRRLLDSTILRSCHDVFTAFDENLMFKEEQNSISLQENFKGVFHNISSILDCVQCQQCKLHGKMAMLGYGTALKILFLPEDILALSLSRNEVVAFLNTIAKMSESVREIRELTQLYWATHTRLEKSDQTQGIADVDDVTLSSSTGPLDGVDILDAAVGAVSKLAHQGFIDDKVEAKLIQDAFKRRPELMILSKHYGNDLHKFLSFLPSIDQTVSVGSANVDPDAIVIGTGLAGLAATLNILDRGGRVLLIEKEHRMGGNSNKASSGINACCPQNETYGDFLESFKTDTIRSAGETAQRPLIDTLVENSASAVQWLKDRVGVDLSVLAQLGGHSHKRTHRPISGMVGAEIIYNIQKAVKSYEKAGMVQIFTNTRATKLIKNDNGTVVGVEAITMMKDGKNETKTLTSPNVILATGGFASDRSHGSYLEKYRPELMKMPATAGEFSTGDGITLGTSAGAGLVDMEKVQVHPTGWVDPADPSNPSKILAGELMRGVGGILLDADGNRFCNELGTRAYVVDKMFRKNPFYAETNKWNVTNENPTFSLVLSSSAAVNAKKHVDHYLNKGLLTKLDGVDALAQWMNLPLLNVKSALQEYQRNAKAGKDEWGKSTFAGVPQEDLENEVFYAGTITPVLHYCMGGLTIDENGSVLDINKKVIPGLHAAGEVSGGVHGDNRLGGNSLLECTVYGTIVGKKIPIKAQKSAQQSVLNTNTPIKYVELRKISLEELQQHNSEDDCWVSINDKVYDLTEFAEEHPAGPESIIELAGQDATEAFQAVHSEKILEDFDPIGTL